MRTKVDYRQCSRETYKRFLVANPSIKLSYIEYQNIIYTFNYTFRDYLLEKGEKQKLPYGLGEFAVSKKKGKRKFTDKEGREHIILPVDWKKSKEVHKKIYNFNYHTDGYRCKWRWFIGSARFAHSDIWVFKPARVSSRLITHYLNTIPGQIELYKEWHLF